MTEARSPEPLAIIGGAVPSIPSVPAAVVAPLSAAPARPASLVGQIAWAACDGARNPYNVLVNIFVFAAYFTTVVIPDPVRGQTVWSFVSATGALLVALGGPILGAIADAGGRRKPWLLGCMLFGAPCMASLWFATPAMGAGLPWIMVCLIGGTLCFEWSTVFSSAMLPNVAPPGRIGLLSGLGFSLANFFGIVLFLFYLLAWDGNPHPLFGLDVAAHEPERAVGILAAIWIIVFSIPMFVLTPDSPSTSRRAGQAIRDGLSSLARTLSSLRSYRNTASFLVARLLYNEGFMVMMLFTSVVAAGVLHWTPRKLVAMGLINSVVATLAALFAGWLDQRTGSKRATMFFVGGCLLGNIAVCSITPDMVLFVKLHAAGATAAGAATAGTAGGPLALLDSIFPTLPDKAFLVTQNLIALFVTGGLVTSRSLMAKLSPRNMLNEFFGLYAVSGNATTFLGPLAIGIVTAGFGNQRAGVAVGIAFLLAGLLLMIPVREHEPAR
jgi:MFS transporter, UMF1 family